MTRGVDAGEYHERTVHSPRSVRESDFSLDFANKPTPYKAYVDRPSVPLAERLSPSQLPTLRAIADPVATSEAAERTDVDRETLARLCYYAAGVTRRVERRGEEHLFRAAACTGALYHVDLYVVCGDLGDVDAGVYHFDPRNRSLDVLREGDYRAALAEAAGGEGGVEGPANGADGDESVGGDGSAGVGDAPVTLVATSTWWRNAWKYRERTYRHAFWDSGTVLANLLAVAWADGLPARVVTGFADDAVADLLGVDPAREAPLELVPVGAGAPAPDAPAVDPLDPETEPLSPTERAYDLIETAYAAAALPDGEAVREWRDRGPTGAETVGVRSSGEPAEGVESAGKDAGQTVALDPVDDARASKVPLHRTIGRRGSCRAYERATLNRRKVATVLDRAVRAVPTDVVRRESTPDSRGGRDDRSDSRGDPALRFNDCYLVVNDVEGVPSGAYHYHPDAGALECLREGDFRREAGHLALDQRLAADAGLCAFFLTDVDAVTERLGDRGYRVAQLEAAVTAGKLYLAAYAHRDLGATGLTFYDDEVTEFFAPRAAGQTPTFLWTLGRPA